MATDIDPDERVYSCTLCSRYTTNKMSNLNLQALQSKMICQESFPTINILSEFAKTTVLDVTRHFVFILQRNTRDISISTETSADAGTVSFNIIDLLNNNLIEFSYSGMKFQRYGIKSSELLLGLLNSEIKRLNNRFDAVSLKWDRIEWLKFSINHPRLGNDGYYGACITTTVLNVVSSNTILLISKFDTEDANEQKTSHRNYYRLTVGRPDHLRDLAWFQVKNSTHKHLLRKDPFINFE